MMDDYDIPFDGMSDEKFMYRAMNEDDPMYMGGPTYIGGDYAEFETDEAYNDRAADWYNAQFGKIIDAINDYMADPDDDPRHYFDDIDYNPFPERY